MLENLKTGFRDKSINKEAFDSHPYWIHMTYLPKFIKQYQLRNSDRYGWYLPAANQTKQNWPIYFAQNNPRSQGKVNIVSEERFA